VGIYYNVVRVYQLDHCIKFQKFKMWTAAILKIVLSLGLYHSREYSDFDDIWFAGANFGSKNGRVTRYRKFCKFKMADGRPIENPKTLYIS